MKRRSVLNKQSVKKKKRKKKKNGFPVFSTIGRVLPVLVKGIFLLVIVAGISVSLIYCYHYIHTSPLLKLEQVEVAGVDERIRRELIDMCDLNPDQNLLFLNLDKLKQKMEKHPWVKSIKLDRRFPHTLYVEAKKQRPSALVIRNGIHYMNQLGEIFKEVNGSDSVDFPVITGVSNQDHKARAQLYQAARVMDTLGTQKGPLSLNKLSEIHVQDKEISLYFSHLAAEINVNCDHLSGKLDGLRKLVMHLRKTGRIRHVTSIDLNSVDGAVVSFRKG